MSFSLSPDLKNSLVATARSLREGNEAAALNHFRSIQNTEVENRIYGRLWEVMNRPNTFDFGRYALWNQNGQTAPFSKKTQAIEDVLTTLIVQAGFSEPAPAPLLPGLPLSPGAKEILMPSYFDCGFDPRFSSDGNYLLPPEKLSVKSVLTKWIAYIEFFLRAHLSLNSEERKLRQMILSLAKAENAWSNCTEYAFTKDVEEIPSVFAVQREFLEKASEAHKIAHPDPNAQPRLYPSELLAPVHYTNKPQSKLWAKNYARPKWENEDLSRLAQRGYWRLRNEMYEVYNPTSKRTTHLDPFDLHYVPHYIFINAIEKSSYEMKTSLRDYRLTLSSLITDPQCAHSLQICKERLFPKLEAFHSAWNRYADSHELVKEVSNLFSKTDPHKTSHEYKKWRYEMSKIPFFSDLYKKYLIHFHEFPYYWEKHYVEKARDSLKTAVLDHFPESHNARLLRAYDQAQVS